MDAALSFLPIIAKRPTQRLHSFRNWRVSLSYRTILADALQKNCRQKHLFYKRKRKGPDERGLVSDLDIPYISVVHHPTLLSKNVIPCPHRSTPSSRRNSFMTPRKSFSNGNLSSISPSSSSPSIDASLHSQSQMDSLSPTHVSNHLNIPLSSTTKSGKSLRSLMQREKWVRHYMNHSDEWDLEPWEQKRVAVSKMRMLSYKSRNKRKTASDRVQQFLKSQKTSHDLQVLLNRGLYIAGLSNSKQNLGNILNISEKYIKDLDMDHDQSTPSLPNMPSRITLQINSDKQSVMYLTLQGTPSLQNPQLEQLFKQACHMVRETFQEKAVEIDLKQGLCDDDFSVAMLLDEATGEIMAAVEYVFMRKYLWIDCFAVKKEYQRSGIGRVLMERMMQIAHERDKDVLLYALTDVIPFYSSFGFSFSASYPPKPWHIGRFMTASLT